MNIFLGQFMLTELRELTSDKKFWEELCHLKMEICDNSFL
jgi:hypothetical protein